MHLHIKWIRILAALLVLVLLSVPVACGTDAVLDDQTGSVPMVNSGADTPEIGGPAPELNVLSQNTMLSREQNTFANINGATVTVDTYARFPGEYYNHPNIGQGFLMAGCIAYKLAHPDAEVYLTVTSFHYSIVLAQCFDKDNPAYGKMKSVYDREYDDDGFVRLAYLAVYAAKIGIHTTVVGQLDASAALISADSARDDVPFATYFTQWMGEDSDIPDKKIGDFLTLGNVKWTSYGDRAAADMMHAKTCSVSNYINPDGVECGPSIWVGSINLDGIDYRGLNTHDSVQSGVVVTNHAHLQRVVYNYTQKIVAYCGQEDVALFRAEMRAANETQIDLIRAGRADEIPLDAQIVYLGTPNDTVFEFYATPFGGSPATWDAEYNPYCRYIGKLLPAAIDGEGDIVFAWNNPKYNTNFEFAITLADFIRGAFYRSGRVTNRLYLHCPGFDTGRLDNLVVGENIAKKVLTSDKYIHNKDFQLSYIENGTRYWVSAFNSINFHQGSMSYQANTLLLIKETEKTGNGVWVSYGKLVSHEIIAERDRVTAS